MGHPQLLCAISEQLRGDGVMVFIQSNRDFKHSEFLDAYETLLKEMSP